MMISPCFNCPDRSATCQIDCQRYAEWRKEFEDRKNRILTAKQKENLLNDFKTATIAKTKRRKRK